jgi:hypothetical protein
MTGRLRLPLALCLLGLSAVTGAGCDKIHSYNECIINGIVVDGGSGAPIDGARVYVTSYHSPPLWPEKRHLECYTDGDGELSLWYDSGGVRLFEIEKEGCLPASQTLEGSGQLYFMLERAVP